MTAKLKNWNLMRLLRLAVGIWAIYVSFTDRQLLFGILGAMFLVQALFNIGCIGQSCNMPNNPTKKK